MCNTMYEGWNTRYLCLSEVCQNFGCSILCRHISCYTVWRLSLRRARCFIVYQVVWVSRKLSIIFIFQVCAAKRHNFVLHYVGCNLQNRCQCFKHVTHWLSTLWWRVAVAPKSCICRAKAQLLCTDLGRHFPSCTKTQYQPSPPKEDDGLMH